jgi:hypothetical protein
VLASLEQIINSSDEHSNTEFNSAWLYVSRVSTLGQSLFLFENHDMSIHVLSVTPVMIDNEAFSDRIKQVMFVI